MRESINDTGRAVDEALLQEIAGKIAGAFCTQRIILFGSRARGVADWHSDIDLFVEMETPDMPLERYCKVIQLFPDRWWPMDLIVMTPEEVRARRNSKVSIVPTVEKEGRMLYDATRS